MYRYKLKQLREKQICAEQERRASIRNSDRLAVESEMIFKNQFL
jgi:hypothetical protein